MPARVSREREISPAEDGGIPSPSPFSLTTTSFSFLQSFLPTSLPLRYFPHHHYGPHLPVWSESLLSADAWMSTPSPRRISCPTPPARHRPSLLCFHLVAIYQELSSTDCNIALLSPRLTPRSSLPSRRTARSTLRPSSARFSALRRPAWVLYVACSSLSLFLRLSYLVVL
jgi:hypothetical protein